MWAELRTMQSPEGALWAHMRGLQAALEALTDAGQLKGAQLIVLSSFDHMIALVCASRACQLHRSQLKQVWEPQHMGLYMCPGTAHHGQQRRPHDCHMIALVQRSHEDEKGIGARS